MNEVQRADFGIFAQRKARQGEEPAAQAVTGDESLNFFVGVCPWEKFRTFRAAKSPSG